MEPINYISIALSAFCIVISVIILTSSLIESDRKAKLNRLFNGFVLCNIGIISSDIIAWLMTGNTELYAYYLIRIANFLHYVFGSLVLTAMTFYMLTYIELKTTVPRRVKIAPLVVCALSLLLTVISQFNGMYYIIDESNVYHRQGLFWVSQLLPITAMVINMLIVLIYRKDFRRKYALFFLTYFIFPITALCLQMLFFGITLINLAATLTVVILYIGIQTERTKDMASQIMIMNHQLGLQGAHYEMLQSHIEETKKARHDLRHHLSVFQSYIETGETEKLAEYVNEYRESLPDDTGITFCNNYAVNSILRYYISIARSEGIQVETRLELPENTGVSDSDLCIIFGNCVENAIEACRRIHNAASDAPGDKFLRINAKTAGKILAITVDNSFDGQVNEENGVFLSRKRRNSAGEDNAVYAVADNEGIGVSSVKAAARKYDGEARFEAKGNVFQASIMLNVG